MCDFNSEAAGTVFDIQDFAVSDGPGVRTLVFLKGCPLRCEWCSNPESQESKSQVLYYAGKCSNCGKCVDACPSEAIAADPRFGLVTIHNSCTLCGACVDACLYEARKLVGEEMSVGRLLEVLRKKAAYYRNSGGGVTVSGGEPYMQPDFLAELLKGLKHSGISSAVETSGYADWSNIALSLEYLDLIFYDIKHVDSGKHYASTGVDNGLILENFKRLAANFSGRLVARIPYIPGFNSDEADLRSIFSFLSDFRDRADVELLPYHRFGSAKYDALGRGYPYGDLEPVPAAELRPWIETAGEYGLKLRIG